MGARELDSMLLHLRN